MKDWKAAYRSEKHVTLSQPLLSVCGLFPYADTFLPLYVLQSRLKTSCSADVKMVPVSNLDYAAFHKDTAPVRTLAAVCDFSSWCQLRNKIQVQFLIRNKLSLAMISIIFTCHVHIQWVFFFSFLIFFSSFAANFCSQCQSKNLFKCSHGRKGLLHGQSWTECMTDVSKQHE